MNKFLLVDVLGFFHALTGDTTLVDALRARKVHKNKLAPETRASDNTCTMNLHKEETKGDKVGRTNHGMAKGDL